MAVGSGPAGPVLAGPIIFKVSNDRQNTVTVLTKYNHPHGDGGQLSVSHITQHTTVADHCRR